LLSIVQNNINKGLRSFKRSTKMFLYVRSTINVFGLFMLLGEHETH